MKHVIATSRPQNFLAWPETLSAKTGEDFFLVTDQEKLTVDLLKKIQPRYVFFPHWSHKIPQEIHENFECVIFHMTDLPFGRGGSPLQNLIQRGFKETKISALRCTDGIDAGPIYLKKNLSLAGSAEEIYQRAADVIFDMITEIFKTNPKAQEQKGEIEVFQRRKPEESVMTNIISPEKLYDHIRMLDADGYPKAFLETQDWRLEFDHAEWTGDTVTARVVFKTKNGERK